MINEAAVSKVLNKILKHESNKPLLEDIKNLNMSTNPYADPNVDKCSDSLYEIYKDINEFCQSVRRDDGKVVYNIPDSFNDIINNPTDADDEEMPDQDYVDVAANKDSKLALKTFVELANAVAASETNLPSILPSDKFESLFKDMIMSASMRSWRLYTFMNDPKFENVKASSLITKGKKLVGLRLQKKNSLEYRDTDIYHDYANEFHKDFPISVASDEAINTFMQSKTPFAVQARMQYLGSAFTEAVDTEEGLSPEEYESRKSERAAWVERSKEKRKDIQKSFQKRTTEQKPRSFEAGALDYITYSTVYFMSGLISKGDIKTTEDVDVIFKNTNNGLDRGSFDSSAVAIMGIEDFDEAPSEQSEQERTTILDDQEIHNEYVIVVCKKVIERLSDEYLKDFDFFVIDPPGSGSIVKKNLYRDFVRPEFDNNLYSKNGALLIQQLYRNWLVGDESDESTGQLNTKLLKVKQDISDIIKKLPTKPIQSSYLTSLSSENTDFAASTVHKNVLRVLQPNTAGGRFANKVGEHLRKFFISYKQNSKLAPEQLIAKFDELFNINLKTHIGRTKKGETISSGSISSDDSISLFKDTALKSFRNADLTKILYKSQSPGLDPDKRILYLVKDNSDVEKIQNELFNASTSTKPILPLYKSKEQYELCVSTYERLFNENIENIKNSTSIDQITNILYIIASQAFGQDNIIYFRNCKEFNKPKTSPSFGTSFFPEKQAVQQFVDKVLAAGKLTKASPSIAFNTAVSIIASKGLLKGSDLVNEAVDESGYSYEYERISNTVNLYCEAYLLKAVLSFSKIVREIEKLFSNVLSKLDNHTKELLYEDSETLQAGPSYDEETDTLVEKICDAIKNAIEDEESEFGSQFETYSKHRQSIAKRRTRSISVQKMKEGKPLSELPELSEEDLF